MAPKPILLAIEDEALIVELLATIVAPLGVELVSAVDGRHAIAILETVQPALITLDLVLPDLDGFQVLAEVRRRGSLDEVPVVVMSALSDAPTMKRAYALGASDFVAKPFNVAIVELKLRTFLRMVRLVGEMRERERFLADVMENLSSCLLVCAPSGRILKINDAGAAAFGLPDTEAAIGQLLAEVAPGAEAMLLAQPGPARKSVMVQPRAAAFADPAAPIPHPRSLGYTTSQLSDGAIVAVFRELTASETARREVEVRARQETLAQAAASFAHEVRNPLAAIAAAAQVIGRDDADRAMQKRLARAVESEALRVTGLVREYVERQVVTAAPTDVDLGALLDELVEVNLIDKPARSRVRVSLSPSLPRVRADAARIKQVVLNLLINAIQATEAGGTISMEATADGGGVKLAVRDTGTGIERSILPRIFDEGFTTRPGGRGLGLSISKKIIEEQGGSLRAESVVGRGTTFTVWWRAARG